MKIRLFSLFSIGLTALLLAIGYVLAQTQGYAFAAIAPAILLSFITTLISYILTFPTLEKKFIYFLYAVLGSMMGKMFLGICSILIIALYFKEWKMVYVISYFFSYFLYTFFEVYALMRNLRPFSKKEVETESKTEE